MNLNDMINHDICFEGNIEVRRWDNDYDPTILFYGDAYDMMDADGFGAFANEHIRYMFAYNGSDGIVLCIELDN